MLACSGGRADKMSADKGREIWHDNKRVSGQESRERKRTYARRYPCYGREVGREGCKQENTPSARTMDGGEGTAQAISEPP